MNSYLTDFVHNFFLSKTMLTLMYLEGLSQRDCSSLCVHLHVLHTTHISEMDIVYSIRRFLGVQHRLEYVIAKTILISLNTVISFYRSTVLIQATNKTM